MRRLLWCFAFLLMGQAGAAATETLFPAPAQSLETLRVASVTDLVAVSPFILKFQTRHPNVSISYEELTSLDLDDVVTKACSEDKFFADVVISSAVAEQVRLVNNGCAQALHLTAPTAVPPWALWRNELVGLTFEPAVIVYDTQSLTTAEVPHNRFELIDLLRQNDRLKGKVGTYDIETSGVGYIFAFEDAQQASTWGRLLESLGQNDVQRFCCTSQILDRVADGRLSIGYNVLGSYALSRQRENPRLGIIFPGDYTLALSRAALIPTAAKNANTANLFIDYALSAEGQRSLADGPFLFSSITGADELQQVLGTSAQGIPFRPIELSPALLVPLDKAKRHAFIEEWRRSINE